MTNRCLLTTAWLLLGLGLVGSAEEPRIIRENIEWLDVWVPNANLHDRPRVLLIGDSITRGYGREVEQKLQGKAYVARLATSKCVGDPALLTEVALVLGQYRCDVIHFNNGMHGWGYSEAEYAKHFPDLVAALKKGAQRAKLIWATTTPVREANHLDQFSPRTERVRARNRIAREVVTKEKIPLDDLFALVEKHPEYYAKDGVHFGPQGVAAQAAQVAERILDALK